MKKRIVVTIGGREFTIIAEEDEAYVKKVAAYVDGKISQTIESLRVSLTDGALLTAMNMTDEYFKSVDTAENLRTQLKDYLEEASRAKTEISELKRELSRLTDKSRQDK